MALSSMPDNQRVVGFICVPWNTLGTS